MRIRQILGLGLGVSLGMLSVSACDDGASDGPGPPLIVLADGAMPDMHRVDAAILDAAILDAATPDAALDPPDVGEPEPTCATPQGTLPADVVVLAFHDGEPVGDVSTQTWSVVGETVAESPLHESVVFDLDRPARILGYAVQYGALPADANAALAVGLHPDFGYNGFDFWAPDPLATVSVCRGDVADGEWTEFILPEPVEITDPGLVHVAHRRAAGGAAWAFDGTPPTPDCGNDCCTAFGACHSAWNFPGLVNFQAGGQQNYSYNGLSLTFQFDYMVRLYVQYTDAVEPAETLFTALPEVALSNRSAWADVDNDGDEDLLTNGPQLWRNDGGAFVDATADSGLSDLDLAGSGVFGDYDNDGCLDIFVFDESFTRSDHLLRGDCLGGFVDVTDAAGITDIQGYQTCQDGDRAPTPAAAWIDLDSDGFLDLYLANFICWDSGRGYLDTVWRSRGDGTFEEWTGQNGFAGLDDRGAFLSSRGALPADFDGDGDVDVLANAYRLNRNLYYRNEGDGTFVENGAESGLAGRPTVWGLTRYHGHSIGAAVGDLDGDADLDVIVANLAHPRFFNFSNKTQVLINQGEGRFEDIQGDWQTPRGDAGLRYQETHSVPTLGDFDNNGTLDLVISAVYEGRPTDFYWGNGDGTFRLDAWRSGLTVTNGWGQATADFDQDGRLDLAARGALYRNQRATDGHWLQTRVVGNQGSNRAGIGATVYVEAGEETIMRIIGGGTGQGCQDSLSPHSGLGAHATVDRIRVRFPGHAEDVVYAGPFDADQRVWLYEDGTVATGWVADW